jgi:hypothetical protein
MSVNVTIKPTSNISKWESLQSGDFAMLEGIPEHPIPNGLYRVFIVTETYPAIEGKRNIFLIPMFDGPFEENAFPYILNAFPYILNNFPLPIITQKVNGVTIDVEVNQ